MPDFYKMTAPPAEAAPRTEGVSFAVEPPVTLCRGETAGGDSLEVCLAELVRFYRHSAVGRRCTGIIHQMNSPLQVLSFLVELLMDQVQEERQFLQDPPLPQVEKLHLWSEYRLKKFQQFRTQVEKIQTLVRRLLSQGLHEETQEPLYLDLNRIYGEELELYQADAFFKHQVEKVIRLQPGLPPVYGHYIDFSQSFRNLLDNALEAMAGTARRVLTVETELAEGRIILHIGDTGAGIPPEILPKLFTPFFSTKSRPGRPRAGLGLYLARRLLAPYLGRLDLASQPGETWVTVTIPLPQGQGNS